MEDNDKGLIILGVSCIFLFFCLVFFKLNRLSEEEKNYPPQYRNYTMNICEDGNKAIRDAIHKSTYCNDIEIKIPLEFESITVDMYNQNDIYEILKDNYSKKDLKRIYKEETGYSVKYILLWKSLENSDILLIMGW